MYISEFKHGSEAERHGHVLNHGHQGWVFEEKYTHTHRYYIYICWYYISIYTNIYQYILLSIYPFIYRANYLMFSRTWWIKLTWGLFFSRSSVNFSSSATRNSRGFLRTQAGCAMKILRKTPPTASSPSASPNATANSSGSCRRGHGQAASEAQGQETPTLPKRHSQSPPRSNHWFNQMTRAGSFIFLLMKFRQGTLVSCFKSEYSYL